jgi:hypothetical protein
MALEVSCRRPVQVRAQSQAIECGICGQQLALEQVFSSRVRFSCRQCLATNYPYLFMHLSPSPCNLITTDSILYKTLKKKVRLVHEVKGMNVGLRTDRICILTNALKFKRLTDMYRRISVETEMLFLSIKSVSFYRIPNHGRSCIRRDIT